MRKLHILEQIPARLSDYILFKPSVRHEFLFMTIVLAICSLLGFILYLAGFAESNIITVYFIGVLIVAALTECTRYWVLSSIFAVLLFNCLFAEPRFTLFYYDARHTVTMIFLLCASLVVGYLARLFRMRTAERAELALEAKAERLRVNLLRSISHDLRTPLTGIYGDAQLLINKDETIDAATRRRLYSHICDNSNWLMKVIENILAITRLDSGEIAINKAPELLSDLVEETVRHVTGYDKQRSVDVQLCDELLFVNVDARLIEQVLSNLLDNAIKHTPPGERVGVSMQRDGERAVVEVSDAGPGARESRAHMFEMFYSEDTLDTSLRRGVGLGLPLAKSIIELHGGEISYRDNIPHGAVFSFYLPLEKMEELHD